MGGTNAYLCERCPLIIELGGHEASGGGTSVRWIQIVCTACGTLHRLTERSGVCQVTALPGPIRSLRLETVHADSAGEFPRYEWASESDWRLVGEHPGGIRDLPGLPCSHCRTVGRMLTLERLLYPGGYAPGAARHEDCPLCGEPLRLLAVTDMI